MDALPAELLTRVFARLDVPQLLHCLRVSKAWWALIRRHTDWKRERSRRQKPDYTRPAWDFDPHPPPDPIAEALVELGRCARLEREWRRPADKFIQQPKMALFNPEWRSPAKFNGAFALGCGMSRNLESGTRYFYQMGPAGRGWRCRRMCFLPDRRHFAALAEQDGALWLGLFQLEREGPLVQRLLGIAPSRHDIPDPVLHVCGDRLIVLTESRQFVLGLPRLHQLVRPSMEKSEVQRQRTIFPYGDGSQALAVRALDERLSIYQLPSVTLLQQVKLPGRLLSSELSPDTLQLAVLRTGDHHQLWLHLVPVQRARAGGPQQQLASVLIADKYLSYYCSVEFRGADLLMCWLSAEHTLHVLDLQLRLRWRVRLPSKLIDDFAKVLFVGADSMVVDGRLVFSWRREPGRLLRRLHYSPLMRLHNPR